MPALVFIPDLSAAEIFFEFLPGAIFRNCLVFIKAVLKKILSRIDMLPCGSKLRIRVMYLL